MAAAAPRTPRDLTHQCMCERKEQDVHAAIYQPGGHLVGVLRGGQANLFLIYGVPKGGP